ncbi:uncharacterized protein LOC107820707 [Nicotiana tabacum]|uniref:Uncharacterized protein LOC107820707 n=1 Tax=Nicotiana tabacum TaxID=4097 RepID=A0AC58TGQ8_TOBAC
MEPTTHSSSPRQIRAEMRTKQMHDVDAGGSSIPGGKQLKRKGKEVCVDDDFAQDVPKIPTVKKPKLSPASSKQKTKKQSKKLPKLVQKKNLVKNRHYVAPHNVDYGVLRFHTFTTESGEKIGVLTLPNKIDYEDEQGAPSSEVPNADSPTLEPKHTDCQEDKESVAKKLRKLEKGIEQFAGSSTKNNDQQQGVNNQQFQFNIGDQVHASTSNTAAVCLEHVPAHVDLYSEFQEAAEVKQADIEDINTQSPIHRVTVAAQIEQVIEKQINEGEDTQHVDEVVSEGSDIDKKGVTLYDFELPDNLTQLVKYGEPIPDESTPIHPGRTKQPGKHARSPFIPLYSSGGSNSIGPKFFYLKHPFTTLIGENVDSDVLDKFNKWLYHRSDKVSKGGGRLPFP